MAVKISNKSRYPVAAKTAGGVIVVRPGKSVETKFEVLNAELLGNVQGVKVSGEPDTVEQEAPVNTGAPAPAAGAQKAPATPTPPSAPKAPGGQATGS